jgi:hypothetical protein
MLYKEKEMDNETCYAMIDRFLQNNLYSDDYEKYLEALDQLCQPYPRTWVGLTNEEIEEIKLKAGSNVFSAIMFTNDRLEEKNA